MAHRSKRVSEYKGRYHRTLGKVLSERGEVIPKKFLLGTDRAAAEVANRLLEKLWDEVLAEHEHALRFHREWGGRLGDCNLISGVVVFHLLRRFDRGPVWRAESLAIAEAIRHHQRDIAVDVGADVKRPSAYVERIATLRRTYSAIAFGPADAQLYAAGQRVLTNEARHLVAEAHALSAIAQTPLPVATGHPSRHRRR